MNLKERIRSDLGSTSSGTTQPALSPDSIQCAICVSATPEPSGMDRPTHPMHILDLPGFVGLDVVLQIIPIGRSKWFEGAKAGVYPRSVSLGFGRRRAYRRSDIKALVERLVKGGDHV